MIEKTSFGDVAGPTILGCNCDCNGYCGGCNCDGYCNWWNGDSWNQQEYNHLSLGADNSFDCRYQVKT